MSVQWWAVVGLSIVVLALTIYNARHVVFGLREDRHLRNVDTLVIRFRGGKAVANLVLDPDQGRVYRVTTRRRGRVLNIHNCPPSERLVRLHVARLAAERNHP